jgi:TonB family protein
MKKHPKIMMVKNPPCEQIYLIGVRIAIHKKWKVPEEFLETDYKTHIYIEIQKDGTISNATIDKKSGNDDFDKSAMQALENASPLEKIPSCYKKDTLIIGIEFTLPPKSDWTSDPESEI